MADDTPAETTHTHAEHTIVIRRDSIPYEDWRHDPRWDQLMEYARELFGDGLEAASGRLVEWP